MALILCYECEKEISDQAPACPHCGALKEEQPPQIEEAEILESVAVVDEPEPITQETASAPSTEPEPVATKNERFNPPMAFVVGIFVFQIARFLGMDFGALTVVFLLVPWALLVRYGKKQSPQAYAGIIGALVVVFGIAVVAGPGDVFIPTSVEYEEPQSAIYLSGYLLERAERGDAYAQHTFGLAYANGDSVPQDYVEAVRWYRLAAEQGYAEAQHNLGNMYLNGYGVPQENVLAHMWSNLAAAQGDESAQETKDSLEERMTSEQITEAQRMSREWIEAHPPPGN